MQKKYLVLAVSVFVIGLVTMGLYGWYLALQNNAHAPTQEATAGNHSLLPVVLREDTISPFLSPMMQRYEELEQMKVDAKYEGWDNKSIEKDVEEEFARKYKMTSEQVKEIKRYGSRQESLLDAAYRGDGISVRRYLKQGADPNVGWFGRPLAAAIPFPSLVSLLLKAGADPNATISTEYEDSVFMHAVERRALSSAKLMLQHGAKVNYEGRFGNRALDFAVRNRDTAIIRLLKKHKAIFGTRIER